MRGRAPTFDVTLVAVGALALACASAGSSNTVSQTSAPAEPPTVHGGTMQPVSYQAPAPGATGEARPAREGDPYREALKEAYQAFRGLEEGKNADYIPALAKVDPDLYGIALVTAGGAVYEVGAARNEFSIQSIGKVFTLARAVDSVGAEAVQKRIGVNATGQPFNSVLAIELLKERKQPAGNPFVNAGAISTVDLLPEPGAEDKWNAILGTYSAFAGRSLAVNQEVYRSESETNMNNRAIVHLLKNYEVIKGDPMEALDLYTRECSVSVNARDLAIMGATLAAGGRNPISKRQVVTPQTARHVLAVMMTAGLYETTGEWVYKVGVPAKSGVGGGIVAVVPGRFAVGTFAPPLDQAGNSVRGQRAIESIVRRLGANLFASRPAPAPAPRPAAGAPTPVPAAGAQAKGAQ
jgi:glutaminase